MANLEAAGQREVELKRLMREKQTEIREAKKQRRQGGANFSGGRMSKKEQNAENMRRDELKRLEEGLLPGEPDRTPAPTTRDLFSSAAAHSTDHAGGTAQRYPGRVPVGPNEELEDKDEEVDGSCDSDDIDHDDLGDAEEEEDTGEDAVDAAVGGRRGVARRRYELV